MKIQNSHFWKLLILETALVSLTCTKKKLNESLFEDSRSSELTFYKNKDTIYEAKGGSPHGRFKLKFNETAISALGADGKLPKGSAFPDGSVIVKEAYEGSSLTLYIIMKKDSKSKYAANKWVWGEYDPNGKIVYNLNKEGSACTGCHNTTDARDFTRSFDLH
jgi:hypothetical protein